MLRASRLSTEEDNYARNPDVRGGFLVKLAYLLLAPKILEDATSSNSESFVFQNIWQTAAPTKVATFSWRLFNRIPTSYYGW